MEVPRKQGPVTKLIQGSPWCSQVPSLGEGKKNDLLHLIESEKPEKMSFGDTIISSGYDTCVFSPSSAQFHDMVKLQMQRVLETTFSLRGP